jgi:ABC-type Fe3+-hydroxamate transport system substrate-binding protein
MRQNPPPGVTPQRVVSILPATTESMLSLGLGKYLAGVTDSFPLPDEASDVARVGEPDSPRVPDIIALQPDLILAGGEDHPWDRIDALSRAGLRVWETAPHTVRQAVEDLRDLIFMYASEPMLQSVVWLDRAVDWLEGSRPEKRPRVFCPRSREGPVENPDGWVTMNGDTYAGDLLGLCGAENVFAGNAARRYPLVTPGDVAAAEPDIILLPGSPFPFTREDASAIRKILPDVPAVRAERIQLVDGRLLFWAGTRTGEAVRSLPDLLRIRD